MPHRRLPVPASSRSRYAFTPEMSRPHNRTLACEEMLISHPYFVRDAKKCITMAGKQVRYATVERLQWSEP